MQASVTMATRLQPMFAKASTALRRQGKFFYLFVAEVMVLVLFPYLDRPGFPSIVFRSLATMAFLAGVHAVSDKRSHRMTAQGLAILAIAPYIMVTLHPNARLTITTVLCSLIFLAFTLLFLLRAVLRTMEVTHDTIYGSLSVYLLIGMTWGCAYLLVVMFQPDALLSETLGHPNHSIDWSDCMFYSFVTLTSLGGGIVPLSPQVRSLSILESVSGVLYVAVLVARLVSVYSASIATRTPLQGRRAKETGNVSDP